LNSDLSSSRSVLAGNSSSANQSSSGKSAMATLKSRYLLLGQLIQEWGGVSSQSINNAASVFGYSSTTSSSSADVMGAGQTSDRVQRNGRARALASSMTWSVAIENYKTSSQRGDKLILTG
jgi:hypothetical protein